MKIGTNFSFPFDRGLPLMVALGWGVALLGLATAFALVVNGLDLNREKPGLEQKLSGLGQEPVAADPGVKAPSADELSGLQGRLRELNGLGAGAGPSTAALLAQMEKMAPPGVRLMSFQNDRESGTVELVAEALSLDDLSRFLETLEKSESFSRVNLAKQTQAPDGSGNWIQFSVDLTEGAS